MIYTPKQQTSDERDAWQARVQGVASKVSPLKLASGERRQRYDAARQRWVPA